VAAPERSGRVYLDHASTSPMRPEAKAAMLEWLDSADPGRVHSEGRAARVALEDARQQIAEFFGTRSRQVILTSGATESINAAAFGALGLGRDRAVVMGDIEHSAVRLASARLASEVKPVGVDGSGAVDAAEVAAGAAEPAVGLVQCQLANHEVGTIQPVGEVAGACRELGVMLHVDAAAAVGSVAIDFDDLGVDLMSVTAHKMGGPKGIGALLVRRGLRVEPLLVGGDQERARRAGLENVAAAIGFAAVTSLLRTGDRMRVEAAEAARLTDRIRGAVSAVEGMTLFGPTAAGDRLPNLVCMGIAGVEAEPVLIGLDQSGVAAHSGSSCSSESLEPSPVLAAMGVDAERSLRLSVGWSTTDVDIDVAVAALPEVVGRLRQLRAGW
jgi:cysteine desulfurase